jgi:hypothetical protein
MCVKHGEDPSTHLEHDPELWLVVKATGEPDQNQVHGIFMTTTRDTRSGYSV